MKYQLNLLKELIGFNLDHLKLVTSGQIRLCGRRSIQSSGQQVRTSQIGIRAIDRIAIVTQKCSMHNFRIGMAMREFLAWIYLVVHFTNKAWRKFSHAYHSKKESWENSHAAIEQRS